MKAINNLQKTVGILANQAKKGFDTAKLEIKIKSYKKESNDIYCKMGKLIYNSKSKNKPISTEELDSLCKEIDAIRNRIKGLEKQITDIKYEEGNEEKNEEQYYDAKYTKLNKSENDLKMIRTDEGIKFLKFCPECQRGNEPDTTVCTQCGHKFV